MNTANFPNNRARKQDEAKERQAAYSALTPQQRLDGVDRRLGAGVGARRERAKLAKAIAAEGVKMVEAESLPTEKAAKPRRQKRDDKRGS